MLCIVVVYCRCIASQLVKWRGVLGCRESRVERKLGEFGCCK